MLTSNNTGVNIDSMMRRLRVWRKERGITFVLSRNGYVANIFEELSEYCRASEIYGKIDALADICVFSLNNLDTEIDYVIMEKNHEPFLYQFSKTFAQYIQEACKGLDSSLNEACMELIKIAFAEIDSLGFNINLVMDETIKEIESRAGYLDNSISKFVKFEGAYTLEDALKKYEGKYSSYDFCKSNLGSKQIVEKWIITFHNGTTKDIIKWYKADYKQCRNT